MSSDTVNDKEQLEALRVLPVLSAPHDNDTRNRLALAGLVAGQSLIDARFRDEHDPAVPIIFALRRDKDKVTKIKDYAVGRLVSEVLTLDEEQPLDGEDWVNTTLGGDEVLGKVIDHETYLTTEQRQLLKDTVTYQLHAAVRLVAELCLEPSLEQKPE